MVRLLRQILFCVPFLMPLAALSQDYLPTQEQDCAYGGPPRGTLICGIGVADELRTTDCYAIDVNTGGKIYYHHWEIYGIAGKELTISFVTENPSSVNQVPLNVKIEDTNCPFSPCRLFVNRTQNPQGLPTGAFIVRFSPPETGNYSLVLMPIGRDGIIGRYTAAVTCGEGLPSQPCTPRVLGMR